MIDLIYLEPKRFTDAAKEVWDEYFFSEEPDGYFKDIHMDLEYIEHYARKADNGNWKKSKLEEVKNYILKLLQKIYRSSMSEYIAKMILI